MNDFTSCRSPAELGDTSIPAELEGTAARGILAPTGLRIIPYAVTDGWQGRQNLRLGPTGRTELGTENGQPTAHEGSEMGRQNRECFRKLQLRVLGRNKREGFYVIIVILLACCAVLGGTIGRTLNNRRPLEASQQRPPTAWQILPNSTLAAATWNDSSANTICYTVFFQANSGALIVSQWNSSTNSWSTASINAALEAKGVSINALKGASLAASYPDVVTDPKSDFLIRVHYVSPQNKLQHVCNNSPNEPSRWEADAMVYSNASSVVSGGQISTYFDYCSTGCSRRNSSAVLYEDETQNIVMLMNIEPATIWQPVQAPFIAPMPNAALAMAKFGAADDVDPPASKIYVDISQYMMEYTFPRTEPETWNNETGCFPLSTAANYQSPRIAATAFHPDPSSDLEKMLITALSSDGTITVHWSNSTNGPNSTSKSKLLASPIGVSALAVHSGMRAYCIEQGEIREYSIDRADPSSWSLVGVVYSTTAVSTIAVN
ncbi:hypothetical protein B0T19DRAFT_124081 [Cercophora scortea]|uniref:Fucose-specific lectin n=1 Tax=Cercophora scortea TaxID=314031 RepID=A0AAE0IY10_9PEZI|nr:hypothetical protein B0T19DRAFT_124081 [Cercophora scortea]